MSSADQPRILIVDDQRDAARSLRAALQREGRGYAVADVPSGEEALLELRRGVDLLVVAERLPGMSGAELLARVWSTLPGTPAIVLSDLPAGSAPASTNGHSVCATFQRPADPAAVVAAANRALFGGEAAEPEQAAPPEPAQEAPAPRPPQAALSGVLVALRTDLGARGACVLGRDGVLLADSGCAALPGFDELAGHLARAFDAAAGAAAYLGGEGVTLQTVEGQQHDICALSAGASAFIAVLFDGGASRRQMGMVLRYGRAAAQRIAAMLGGSPPAPAVSPPAAQPEAKPPAQQPPAPRRTGTDALMDLSLFDGDTGTPDLDFDGLDDALADAPDADLDAFWEEAASTHTKVSEDAFSLEEAIELGLFPGEDGLDD